jgi:hypothetical protein
MLKRAAGNEEYDRGRAIEGHAFNNQGGFALGLVREMLTGSLEMRAAFDNALGQQRQVISQVHRENENTGLALQKSELLLEFIHRSDADVSAMPRIKRRPVCVGDATGRPWGATTRRERAGRAGVVDGTHIVCSWRV